MIDRVRRVLAYSPNPVHNSTCQEVQVMATSHSSRTEYMRRYVLTPKGAAVCAWQRIKIRAGARSRPEQNKSYRLVELRMTQEQFFAWAIPKYETWFRERPGVTPSIDRIESTGHYEISNIRLAPLQENRLRNSRRRNAIAPFGKRWCSGCQDYFPIDEFSKRRKPTPSNPLGLFAYCKTCEQKQRDNDRPKQAESERRRRATKRS